MQASPSPSPCVMGNAENRNNREFQKEGEQLALTKTTRMAAEKHVTKAGTSHTRTRLSDARAQGGRALDGRGHQVCGPEGHIWESPGGVGEHGSRECGGAEAAHGPNLCWAGGGQAWGTQQKLLSTASGSARRRYCRVMSTATSGLAGRQVSPKQVGPSRHSRGPSGGPRSAGWDCGVAVTPALGVQVCLCDCIHL